jgi:pentatricopeptide repeat protein
MLAWAQLNAGKNAEAARNYERAFELGIPPGRNTSGVAAYNLACAYARLGRVGDALTMLERAVENGLVDRATYENDEDLRGLRGEARFRAILERLR